MSSSRSSRVGDYPRLPQDHEAATVCRKRGEADGLIDWAGETRVAYNLIRAITKPYPGAHTFAPGGERLTLWRAKPVHVNERQAPGTILEVEGERAFTVATGDGALEVSEWEAATSWSPRRGTILTSLTSSENPS